MLPTLALLLLSFAGVDRPGEGTGAILGTIRYLDEPPAARKILTADGVVLEHRELVVDAKTHGLRDVVVWVDSKLKIPLKQDRPFVIDQRDMVFKPRVAVVQPGQTVRFENNDLGNHGVKSASARPENDFDVTTPPGQAFEFQFKAVKGPVSIGCQLHPWMQAWVFVLPHPYFAVTDSQGRFHIENVPAGKHTLILAHPETMREHRVMVEVIPQRSAAVRVDWRKAAK